MPVRVVTHPPACGPIFIERWAIGPPPLLTPLFGRPVEVVSENTPDLREGDTENGALKM
jgi:hypothetical protein